MKTKTKNIFQEPFFYIFIAAVSLGIGLFRHIIKNNDEYYARESKENAARVIVLEYENKIYKLNNTFMNNHTGSITGIDIETGKILTFSGYKWIHEN